MSRPPLYPLTFTPVLKEYIWGGRKLATLLGRELPPGVNIAESWEIAAHPHGDARVANGALRGRSLAELTGAYGSALTGGRARPGRFPLLVKLLDAHQKLSVQVHPDDAYAQRHEGGELGKAEMWVVLHAEAGASVVLGLQPGATPERLRAALAAGNLEQWLHILPVQAGDAVCVPAGAIHALLGGAVIAEIQQNSDTTYRLYDWNRTGADGRPRPLHVEKALQVIDFSLVRPGLAQPALLAEHDGLRRWQLCAAPTFIVERLELAAGACWQGSLTGETLEIWGTVAGAATVTAGATTLPLPAVQFALLPAALGDYTITAGQPATLLRATLPP